MNVSDFMLYRPYQVCQRSVLLVEDDPYWASVIGRTLRSIDRDVSLRCVKSAEDAGDLLAQNSNFDLIITDQFLDGEATGLDFWKQCRTLHYEIPFVMVSSIKQQEFLDLVDKESNYPFYMSKSFEIDHIQSFLNMHLAFPQTKFFDRKKLELVAIASALVIPPLLTMLPIDQPKMLERAPAVIEVPVSRMEAKRELIQSDLRNQIARIENRADKINKNMNDKITKRGGVSE